MMRFLVLQHSPVDTLGRFAGLLEARGIAVDVIELYTGAELPSVRGYDALWSLGGPMDTWQEDRHPWLVTEKRLIRQAVRDRRMPFLGVCLGHQLLVDALGGEVRPGDGIELGVTSITRAPDGGKDGIFPHTPQEFPSLQWHGAQVTSLPAGATVLASSAKTPVQAIRWEKNAWGVQFHCEVAADTIANWCAMPDYLSALQQTLGPDGPARLERDVENQLHAMTAWSDELLEGFIAYTAGWSVGLRDVEPA